MGITTAVNEETVRIVARGQDHRKGFDAAV